MAHAKDIFHVRACDVMGVCVVCNLVKAIKSHKRNFFFESKVKSTGPIHAVAPATNFLQSRGASMHGQKQQTCGLVRHVQVSDHLWLEFSNNASGARFCLHGRKRCDIHNLSSKPQ